MVGCCAATEVDHKAEGNACRSSESVIDQQQSPPRRNMCCCAYVQTIIPWGFRTCRSCCADRKVQGCETRCQNENDTYAILCFLAALDRWPIL
jgi:hypothetical protein